MVGQILDLFGKFLAWLTESQVNPPWFIPGQIGGMVVGERGWTLEKDVGKSVTGFFLNGAGRVYKRRGSPYGVYNSVRIRREEDGFHIEAPRSVEKQTVFVPGTGPSLGRGVHLAMLAPWCGTAQNECLPVEEISFGK